MLVETQIPKPLRRGRDVFLGTDQEIATGAAAAKLVGDHVVTGAISAVDANGHVVAASLEEQTAIVYERIRSILALFGATLDDLVHATVYLAKLESEPVWRTVHRKACTQGHPALSVVGSALAPGVLISVQAVAAVAVVEYC